MTWIWQRPEWPNFYWDRDKFVHAEAAFLETSGFIAGSLSHLDPGDNQAVTIELLTADTLGSAEIEGEFLDRQSVQSSIRRQLGLAVDRRPASPAEAGHAELAVDVLKSYAAPLSHAKLHAWHGMVAAGRLDLESIGEYRSHAAPMQIVSGGAKRKVHYQAPPSPQVYAEMERFIAWFNAPLHAGSGGGDVPPLCRAGVAHLWFESIHPYEDGNGRIGRAVAEKALLQGLSRPAIISLSVTIRKNRSAYYRALEATGGGLEITPWLTWFADIVQISLAETSRQINFLIDKGKVLAVARGNINSRQEKVLLALFRAGPDGFQGGLSAGKYAAISGAAPATASRDLADLVAKGLLQRTGEKKGARYVLKLTATPTPL